MNKIEHLEERITSMREEMPNMTGRERNTQRRLIDELAEEISRLRRGG